MTREEKQKAIDALKISVPVMAVTQEEFKDYIQSLNKIMDWLEQEPRWIPVSERLPENKKTVLVAFKHFVSGNTIGLGSVILLRDKPHWHVREQNLGTYDVLAWMPLPAPYEQQESEDNNG